jgi:hypothetical protein
MSVPAELAKAIDTERVIKLERELPFERDQTISVGTARWLTAREGIRWEEARIRVCKYRRRMRRQA